MVQPGPRGAGPPDQGPVPPGVCSKNALRRYLESTPGWPRSWGPFGYAVWFPDVRWRAQPLSNTEPAVVLDADDLAPSRVEGRLRSIFEVWRTPARTSAGTGARLLVEALAHDIDIRQPLMAMVEEAKRAILRLSERQYGVLKVLAANRRVAVSGPAGSGKTLLAAEKARRLAGLGLRTLLTCFNRALADHLRTGLKDDLDHSTMHAVAGFNSRVIAKKHCLQSG